VAGRARGDRPLENDQLELLAATSAGVIEYRHMPASDLAEFRPGFESFWNARLACAAKCFGWRARDNFQDVIGRFLRTIDALG